MASSHPATPSSASPSHRPSLDSTLQAVERLVDFDFSKEDILSVQRLGLAGVGKIGNLLHHEGHAGVGNILHSLEGQIERTIGNLVDTITNDRRERGRQPFINPSPSPIDNNDHAITGTAITGTATTATTATSVATLLRPPLHSLRRHSRTPSGTLSMSSKGSSSLSTNFTQPSLQNKVVKRPSLTKRTIFCCPGCEKSIKNGFDKHFKKHLDAFLSAEVGEHDSIGCGYCPAHDVLADQGKAFRGLKSFMHHIKDAHASSPGFLNWDFNASFSNILSAQDIFRRKIIEQMPNNRDASVTLSWARSPRTQVLLNSLRIVSRQIDSDPSSIEDMEFHNLMVQVYQEASQNCQNWQYVVGLSPVQPMPQHAVTNLPLQQPILQPQLRSSPYELSFAGIGQRFDPHTSNHTSFASDIQSPMTSNPAPQAHEIPFRDQRRPIPYNMMNMISPTLPPSNLVPQMVDVQLPRIAFDGHAQPRPTPPPQHFMEELYNDIGINESDLYGT